MTPPPVTVGVTLLLRARSPLPLPLPEEKSIGPEPKQPLWVPAGRTNPAAAAAPGQRDGRRRDASRESARSDPARAERAPRRPPGASAGNGSPEARPGERSPRSEAPVSRTAQAGSAPEGARRRGPLPLASSARTSDRGLGVTWSQAGQCETRGNVTEAWRRPGHARAHGCATRARVRATGVPVLLERH